MDAMTLKPKLSRLKLSGILETLGGRLEQAQGEKWSYSQFLDFLLSDEVERRDHKQLVRRLLKSELDAEKTLESFDFAFNPRVHEPTIRELAGCAFLKKNENLFFLGPSGVGKTHLAQAIGTRPCAAATRCSTAAPRLCLAGSPPERATAVTSEGCAAQRPPRC
jgi:DNA replication protein DnaC